MMWKSFSGLLLLLICCLSNNYGVESAKILVLYPAYSKTAYFFGRVLVEELAARGHEVTYVASFSSLRMDENIRQVRLEMLYEHLDAYGMNKNYLTKLDESVLEGITNHIYESAAISNYTLSHVGVQQGIFNSTDKYDLVIMDSYSTDSLLGFAYHFGAPSMVISSGAPSKWANEMVANPNNPSYTPSAYLGYSNEMSFKERVLNTLISLFDNLSYNYLYLPAQEAIYKRYFSPYHANLPPLIDLIHNVSLVLVNTHPLLQYPRPYVPNMIEIPGLQLRHVEDLGTDLNKYIEEAEDGVIFFSGGADLQTADWSLDRIEAFMNTFIELKTVRVLWKWENISLPLHPPNIVVGPWWPQQEVLSHPNVRMFITIGGHLSMMEALANAKPIIGVPIFGDHILNVDKAVKEGYGIKLDYNNLSVAGVRSAIEEILNNSTYRQNALRLSRVFRENPMKPIDKAIYHIEQLIKTGGANYLRSSALNLSFWEKHLIDVSVVIILGILIIVAVPSIIIGLVLRKSNPNKDANIITNSTFKFNNNKDKKAVINNNNNNDNDNTVKKKDL